MNGISIWRKAGLDGHTALSAVNPSVRETSNLLPASCWSLRSCPQCPAGKHWNRLLIFFTSYKPLIYPFKEKLCHVFVSCGPSVRRIYPRTTVCNVMPEKLTKFLLLIPMMLLPKAVLAMEILPIWFAMSNKVPKQHSLITDYCAVHRRNSVSRGPDWLKKVGKQGGMGLASCIVSIVLGRYLSPDLK